MARASLGWRGRTPRARSPASCCRPPGVGERAGPSGGAGMTASDDARTTSRESPWSGRRLHFVGVGGAGMSGYARAAHALGAQVSGSDRATSPYPSACAADGVLRGAHRRARRRERAGRRRRGGRLLERRPAENPERAAARERGLPERSARGAAGRAERAAAHDRGGGHARQDDDRGDARARAARRRDWSPAGWSAARSDRGLANAQWRARASGWSSRPTSPIARC